MRVALADDAGLVRDSLTRVLEGAGIEVLIAAASGGELLAFLGRLAPEQRPTAVMVDINMKDDGLDTASIVRERYPDVGILVLSNDLVVSYAERLVRTVRRGVGYYGKETVVDADALVHVLGEVARGETMIDPGLVAEMVRARAIPSPLDGLSRRERDVLALMAEGLGNPGIATRLHVSPRTVETHAANIFEKLNVPNSAEYSRRVLAVLTWQQSQEVPNSRTAVRGDC